MRNYFILTAFIGIALATTAQLPKTLPANPGNVFTQGQEVSIQVPSAQGRHWVAVGYGGAVVAQGTSPDGKVNLGALPVGFYMVRPDGGKHSVTAAVLAPLVAPTPPDSPIGIDTAAAQLYKSPEQWKAVASLSALAGMSWERDRFLWVEIQPQKGAKLGDTKYDTETAIMHNAGLHVLEVMQGMPGWTGHEDFRFPPDLRDVFNFYHDLALRCHGIVNAIETSNELDVQNTGAELATNQKAAYLGIKSGDPGILVNSNAWTEGQVPDEMLEFKENGVDPYIDNISIHHYQALPGLPALYSNWRQMAPGKPIWTSEFNLNPVPPVIDPETNDPTWPDLKVQTESLVKLYATSLFMNVKRAFFFVLADHIEAGRQYGLLHDDLTPRPGYLALAATGRLLAGARPIARLQVTGSPNTFVYAFQALPNGQPKDVIVAWNDDGTSLRLPVAPEEVFDNIGRSTPFPKGQTTVPSLQSPTFLVFPKGAISSLRPSQDLKIVPPPLPAIAATPASPPSPIVLQAIFKAEQMIPSDRFVGPVHPSSSAVRIDDPARQQIQLFAYNFSGQALAVRLSAQAPSGWRCNLAEPSITIPPMGRVQIPVQVTPGEGSRGSAGEVRITGSNAVSGNSVLVVHLTP